MCMQNIQGSAPPRTVLPIVYDVCWMDPPVIARHRLSAGRATESHSSLSCSAQSWALKQRFDIAIPTSLVSVHQILPFHPIECLRLPLPVQYDWCYWIPNQTHWIPLCLHVQIRKWLHPMPHFLASSPVEPTSNHHNHPQFVSSLI